ncbi:MAG: amidohydrolase family protein, partial [Microbacterium sp.]|nr:amidohydrolase family protein [Microbacterium sp.]
MAADLILTGAVVRTADRARPTADAIAFEGGRVLTVGAAEDVLAHRDEHTEVRDLAGAAVYPGFVDVHTHHALAGRTDLFELSLPIGLSLDGILDHVRAHAADLPADAWISGGPFASTMLEELCSSAVRARLDEASDGRPTVIVEDSRHNRWANSRALELAGISADSLPAGGVAVLDRTDGTLTGVLLEAAGIPVEDALSRGGGLTAEQHRQASRRGVEMLNAYGVTA